MLSMTTQEFVKLARKKHGYRYTYDCSEFQGVAKPIYIMCKEHGKVRIHEARAHLNGSGCEACSYKKRGLAAQKYDKASFCRSAKHHHADKYDYSKLPERFGTTERVTIGCPKHGWFEQSAGRHASGFGCKHCGLGLQRRQGRSYIFEYKNFVCRSSWELEFVKLCEKRGLRVVPAERVQFRVRYFHPDKRKSQWYYPDFYLPYFDTVVEVKPKKLARLPENRSKFRSARKRGRFMVFTEDHLCEPKDFFQALRNQ